MTARTAFTPSPSPGFGPTQTAAWRSFVHKLSPPAPQSGALERPALRDRICRAQGQLVLLTAPAGFGKTTALQQVRDTLLTQGVRCAWLTLDSADNDLSRFNASLQAACQRAGLSSAESNADPVELLLSHPQRWALLLDEAEVLLDAGVLALLRELAEHLPAHAQLIVAGRKPPAMGLSRLRVRGRLTEIGEELLRFQADEVQALFAKATQHADAPATHPQAAISSPHALQLWQKTEGWPAALCLAQLAMQRSPDPEAFVTRFSGSDRAVADYLSEDVFSGLPARLQCFLLRASILRQLDVPICSALNPQLDCAALLGELEAQRLFLTPVEGSCRSWRYHSLFADFLRTQLALRHPQEPARLHLAASSWYEANDRPVPAIEHAIEGGDLPHALTLMAGHAEALLEQGRMRLLSRWFGAMPEELVRSHPRLEAVAIWALSLTQGACVAMQRLERSAGVFATPALKAHARCMRTMFLAMQDRYDEALAAGNQALPALPTGEAFADATLLNAMAHVTSVFFDEHKVRPLLDASRAQQLPDSRFNRMYTEAIVGMLDLMQGRLRQATERFQMALRSSPKHSQPLGQGNAWAGVLYAHSLYEANQLEAARHQLNLYLPLARDTGLPDHMILGHAMRARMAHWQGDIDTAHQTLAELETLGHQRHLPRVVAAAQLERAHLALLRQQAVQAQAHLNAAAHERLWAVERRQFLIANETQYLRLAQLRWQIAFGKAADLTDVDQALAQEMHLALQAGRQRRLLVLKLLRATVLARMEDWPGARTLLLKALPFAAAEGHVRLVLDEGWPIMDALGRLAQEALPNELAPATRDLLETVLSQLRRLWPTDTDAGDPNAAPEPPRQASAPMQGTAPALSPEALTQREQQVLNLLVEGYSNSAMAEKLFLSDSTVRTHLRNINQKLGARSRTHAVAMARKLGLVD